MSVPAHGQPWPRREVPCWWVALRGPARRPNSFPQGGVGAGPPQAGAALCSFLSWAGVLGSTCRACVPELSAVSLLCFCSHPPPQHRRSPERLLSLRRFSLLPHSQFGPLLRYQHHPFFEGSSSGDLARGSLEKGGVGVPDLHLRPEALVGAHVPCKVVSATRTGVSCSLSVVWLN